MSSIEVNEIDEGIIELLREPRICKHLHVPLQSGDNDTLARMQRKYSADFFRSIILDVANQAPGLALGTDVIVGFPGEDNEAFSHTRELLHDLPFSYMHIFPFSPRPGTAASAMPSQVSLPDKKKRAADLIEMNRRMRSRYESLQAGRVLDVIVEEICADGMAIGTSGNYLKVRICAYGCEKKSLIKVRIAERDGQILSGYPIETL